MSIKTISKIKVGDTEYEICDAKARTAEIFFNQIYPVGSIYISTTANCPLSFGQWKSKPNSPYTYTWERVK